METTGAAWFASAFAFVFAMTATPGPNNTMVTASGATWGFRRTVPHMLGISAGFALMVVVVALGAGELLRGRPWIQEGLRWVGAAYLLFLAWRIASAEPVVAGAARDGARPFGFLQAALFQWVNPKAWVAAVGAVVTFTSASGGTLLGQAAVLAAMFFAVAPPVLALYALAGMGAARILRTRRALRRFNLGMAGLLAFSVLPMLAE